jgi:hypothetical protein
MTMTILLLIGLALQVAALKVDSYSRGMELIELGLWAQFAAVAVWVLPKFMEALK